MDTKTKLGNHQVSIEYKPMDDNTIMLIITDISKVCELEEKLQDERQMLSFITTALKDKRQFFDSIEAFETEIDALYQKIKKEKKLSFEQIQIFYRKIHTHKGIFSQYALPNLPQTLHFLESDLFKKLSDNRLSSEFSQNYFDEAIEAKNRDISILAKYLGEDFINQKEILSISSTKLESLESFANKINDKLGDPHPLSREIKALIKDLRLVPLKNLLLAYPNLALHLATSMEKEIEPFDIAGGDFLVDPRRYSGFTKALIHLFNNAVDHGIEPIDERLELGKPAAGSLSCTITQTPGFFHLQLSDDGRGLNAETIKVKAMEKGIKIPKDLSDKDACLLIFNDDFSLKQDVTQVSGRGIGLSALKAETEALGGTVDVTSILGYGSTFYFKIPYFPKKEL
ncbi:MAG: hypothetical protein GX780_07740 [Campylobacteraceae bacterium]|nr:hypothetical protein [Campylobacteraceae bacterium]